MEAAVFLLREFISALPFWETGPTTGLVADGAAAVHGRSGGRTSGPPAPRGGALAGHDVWTLLP